MKLHWLLALVVLSLVVARADDTEPPTVFFAQIVKDHGTVSISDGASLFTFSKDGTFKQRPLGISGRTVEGRWVEADQSWGNASFIITGNWSWVNGISPPSDPRRMVMAIYPFGKFGTLEQFGKEIPVYKTYFVIEELVKTPAAPPTPQGP
ncbi:hypothetical protein SAMN05444156_1742 [Verrucomicrobium sp. GAS474]|uniref:hypothetical protein n=1 Tax=Verrucomicrobium sp. GAS474 TaxID=1882831 RepID=UPI00087B20C2|nr:hypothetical protein [Verrucomicrobium sp. GAS474]SDU06241.1 hypothetical protein SAMN05444156_1742 [Verrucomicrobium sp. GAS474]